MPQEDVDTRQYRVVVNGEEQYSISFLDAPNALGWRDEGTSGTKAECLAHIGKIWTDMRPLSLRKHMEAFAKKQAEAAAAGETTPSV